MDIGDFLEGLARDVAEVMMRVAELERRNDNAVRHGPVTDVDASKGLARIEMARDVDGNVVKSPWLPVPGVHGTDAAEGPKYHLMPVVGQQMTMVAPNGEQLQGRLEHYHWSDQATQPSQAADEGVFKWGKLTITDKKELHRVEVDQSKHEATPDHVFAKRGDAEFELTNAKAELRFGANAQVECTADKAEVRFGSGIYVRVTSSAITAKIGSSEIELNVGGKITVDGTVVSQSGLGYFGQTAKGGEDGAKIETEDGPSGRAKAKYEA